MTDNTPDTPSTPAPEPEIDETVVPETNGFVEPHERHKNHLTIIAISALMISSVMFAGGVLFYIVAGNRDRIDSQAKAVIATCAVNRAVIDAGLNSIKASVLLPGDQIDKSGSFIPGKLTQQLGDAYPSYAERKERSKKVAASYENDIAKAVIKAANRESQLLISGNKLDCEKLRTTKKKE